MLGIPLFAVKVGGEIVLVLKSVFPTQFILYEMLTGVQAKQVSVIEYSLEILD